MAAAVAIPPLGSTSLSSRPCTTSAGAVTAPRRAVRSGLAWMAASWAGGALGAEAALDAGLQQPAQLLVVHVGAHQQLRDGQQLVDGVVPGSAGGGGPASP